MKRPQDRPGFTLRELMIAMAMGSSIFFAAIGSVHHAMDWSTVSKRRHADDRTYVRLADQLRVDLHRARDAVVEADGTSLRLEIDSGIRYSIDGTTVQRLESNRGFDATIVPSDLARRETYRFEQPVFVRFQRSISSGQFGLNIYLVHEGEATGTLGTQAPLLYAMKARLGLRRLYEQGEIR